MNTAKTFYQFISVDKFFRTDFVKVYFTKSSRSGKIFFQELEEYLAFRIEEVQIDNGREFPRELEEYLREKGIESTVERMNRKLFE